MPSVALTPDLVPARLWLDRLAFLVPGSAATRWLLVADLVCLVVLGCTARWRLFTIPTVLSGGFVALNLLSMAVTDFYLGLALFHLAVGVTTAAVVRRARWAGVIVIALALILGIVT